METLTPELTPEEAGLPNEVEETAEEVVDETDEEEVVNGSN